MERLVRGLDAVNQRLAKVELAVASVSTALLFVINAYAIGVRYLFRTFPAWVIEVSEALLVSAVFMGGAWLYRARRQVAVTLILDNLTPGTDAHRALVVAGELAVLGFLVVALWQAWLFQPILFDRDTPVLGIPVNFVTIFVPVAYASIALSAVDRLIRLFGAHP